MGRAKTLTDIAGRSVTLRHPVSRILLGDGTLAYALALLRPEDPFRG
ncbi:MAG TPA: ABC transporter substrate-binding protein, partial [Erwinia persicina]|nr:ABC transporter substrate-binding protein [Erwinia persicina]